MGLINEVTVEYSKIYIYFLMMTQKKNTVLQ